MNNFLFHTDGQPDWTRLTPFGVAFVCVGALGMAYTAQYQFGIDPCILCLYQRVPYAVAGVLALVAILMPRGTGRRVLLAICIPIFLIGAGVAFYHTGVEQNWWVSVAGCGGALATFSSAADLKANLLAPPVKACGDVDWTLFGLSMTVYNTAVYLGLAVATAYGIRHMRPKGH